MEEVRSRGALLAVTLVAIACGTQSLNTSAEGELRVLETELDFGEIYVGENAGLGLEVSNPAKRAQSVELLADAPFQMQSTLLVPGGSSSTLLVAFQPSAAGSFAASIVIGEQTISLRGTGLALLECREPENSCSTSRFDVTQGQCVIATRPEGAACASVCMTNGICSNGSCLGTLASCGDNNPCTDDGCTEDRGCIHTPRSCPGSTTNPCRIPSCDPITGCQLTDAADGAPCGPRDCHTNTTRVCIAAQCVDRPLPTHECLNLFAYLKASNSESGDSFGSRVAISADGSTLAVGSFVENSGATGINGNQASSTAPLSGAVYVFRRVTGVWVQEAYVKAFDAVGGDMFGYSLALSADGSTLVVGAQLEDSSATGVDGEPNSAGAFDSGAAYVFRRSGSTWAQEAYLKASNTGPNDIFGASIAISADGNTVAVGAPLEDSNATGVDGNQANNLAKDSGAAYLFRRTGGAWAQEAYVKASTVDPGDQFGFSLALSPDGSALSVGAPGEDSKAVGINGNQADGAAAQSGAVFLFRRTASWAQEAYFKASNSGAGDAFGISASLSFDGTALAVGAYGEDSSATGINKNQADNSASQSGAAYVYRRVAGTWLQEAYVKAANAQLGDDFGFSLALSADGNTLVVGAWSENSGSTGVDGHMFNNSAADSGAVYLFRRAGTWAPDAYLKASNTESADVFGYSVAISSDGATLVAAAPGEDSSARGLNGAQADNSAGDSGAVYVFSTQ